MSEAFKKAMAKLAVIGQDRSKLVDCSEVVPRPRAASRAPARYIYLTPLMPYAEPIL